MARLQHRPAQWRDSSLPTPCPLTVLSDLATTSACHRADQPVPADDQLNAGMNKVCRVSKDT